MKIAVSGAAGRMGKRILALAHARQDMEIVAALEAPGHPGLGSDAGEGAGIGTIGVRISDNLDEAMAATDVYIDFTSAEASLRALRAAVKAGKAIVIGSTGFSDAQRAEIAELGPKTRCLVAPNMSVGVNLLFTITEKVARALGSDYDVEIVESHHRLKKDSPSGTADKLARIVADALERDLTRDGVYGRKGLVGERKPGEIGVHAVRGGDIVGEHTVMFITNGERIELTHRAHSRDALASGAIQASVWLVNRPPGLYDMPDVLGLRESPLQA
jgi:4-hydroxy-tetrahydrodipicolinate reductase